MWIHFGLRVRYHNHIRRAALILDGFYVGESTPTM